MSYAKYLGNVFWPSDLCVFYPFPKEAFAWWQVALASAPLIVASVFALRRPNHPYLLVGWLWYLGTLAPVIGWVAIGRQSMADRYSYIPLIGIFVALTWGLDAWIVSRRGKVVLALTAVVVLAVLAVMTWFQVQFWRNSETLWAHAVRVNPRVAFVHFSIGNVFEDERRFDEAERELRTATVLDPDEWEYHFRLAANLRAHGKPDESAAATAEGFKAWLRRHPEATKDQERPNE
jgi:hypothetical protein